MYNKRGLYIPFVYTAQIVKMVTMFCEFIVSQHFIIALYTVKEITIKNTIMEEKTQ